MTATVLKKLPIQRNYYWVIKFFFDLSKFSNDRPKIYLKGHLDLRMSGCYFEPCLHKYLGNISLITLFFIDAFPLPEVIFCPGKKIPIVDIKNITLIIVK